MQDGICRTVMMKGVAGCLVVGVTVRLVVGRKKRFGGGLGREPISAGVVQGWLSSVADRRQPLAPSQYCG